MCKALHSKWFGLINYLIKQKTATKCHCQYKFFSGDRQGKVHVVYKIWILIKSKYLSPK